MNWKDVNNELPNVGETVLTYRPMAKETGDEVYSIQTYTGKLQESPQGVWHRFDRWCHPTHWVRIEQPVINEESKH